MIRVLASGDHHFDEHSRFDECKKIHSWMVDAAREQKADLFLSGGDVYERLSTIREREAVAEWITGMAEVCPCLLVRGNHERQADLEIMGRIRAKHPIMIEESAGVHRIAGMAIGAMAWPNTAELMRALGAKADSQNVGTAAQEAYRAIIMGLGSEMQATGIPRVLLGHWMIDGSVTSLGQPMIGASMNVPLSDLALSQAHMVLASHIHMPQEWMFDGIRIAYCGSPRRTAFGETEVKSVIVADFDESGLVAWHRIPTPCSPMLLLTATWDGHALVDITDANVKGADVRIRYSVSAENREAAKLAVEEWSERAKKLGAVSVKPEPVVSTTAVARTPEIAAAKTTWNKLQCHWKASGVDVSCREDRLRNKVSELEDVR